MNSMTRENAVWLIRQTMLEFQSNVMEPLRSNIGLYAERRNVLPIKLNESFDMYSAAIQNMQGIIDEIFNIDNFQLSQILSLCRDISELYKLPVFGSMPSFISDTSYIRYVSPMVTEGERNISLRDFLDDVLINNLLPEAKRIGEELLTEFLIEKRNILANISGRITLTFGPKPKTKFNIRGSIFVEVTAETVRIQIEVQPDFRIKGFSIRRKSAELTVGVRFGYRMIEISRSEFFKNIISLTPAQLLVFFLIGEVI